MIINKKIIQALKPLNIPISFMEYKGNENKYIVFSTTNQSDSWFYDDKATNEIVNVGLNYYYKNAEDMLLIEDINMLLKKNGFKITSQRDIHKVGTEFYNRAYYLKYVSNL